MLRAKRNGFQKQKRQVRKLISYGSISVKYREIIKISSIILLLAKFLQMWYVLWHVFIWLLKGDESRISQEVPNPGRGSKSHCRLFLFCKAGWLLLHYYAVYIKIKDTGVVAFCYLSLWLNVSDKMFFHKTSFILLVDISTIILCLQIILK